MLVSNRTTAWATTKANLFDQALVLKVIQNRAGQVGPHWEDV